MPFVSAYDWPIHAYTLLSFLCLAPPRYALVLSHWGIPSEGMLQRLGGVGLRAVTNPLERPSNDWDFTIGNGGSLRQGVRVPTRAIFDWRWCPTQDGFGWIYAILWSVGVSAAAGVFIVFHLDLFEDRASLNDPKSSIFLCQTDHVGGLTFHFQTPICSCVAWHFQVDYLHESCSNGNECRYSGDDAAAGC